MKSEKMWDQLAKNWDTRGVRLGENDLKIIELTKKYLNPGNVVLDYGCATGSIALEIAGMAKAVHGIDISTNMVEIAKCKADERNIKISTLRKRQYLMKATSVSDLHGIGD